ncbi:thioesterase family protein [Phenylobacterium sp.]|uniref:thioesterase family protein n=1 Tax=Phenylobacterium sp. TaxID=1871053 RepID=UPI004036193F
MGWDGGTEIWVGGVNTWECDEMGHLNVRHWVAKSMEALAGLAAELGMPDAFSGLAPSTLLVREQHIRFLREAKPGAALTARGGVVAMGDDEARLLIVILHPDGTPAATFQTVVRHATADGGRVFPWSRRIMAEAERLRVDIPDFAAPRSISLDPVASSAASLEAAKAMDLTRIGLGVIGAADCDAFGRMRTEIVMGKISDGILHLLGADRGLGEGPGSGAPRIGGAALEYRLVHFAWPRAGDRFELRSATAHVEERFRRLRHWMIDPHTGRPWASAENVAVGFDLDARKVVRLSPEAVEAIGRTTRPEMAL